jgi:hypothetical protein
MIARNHNRRYAGISASANGLDNAGAWWVDKTNEAQECPTVIQPVRHLVIARKFVTKGQAENPVASRRQLVSLLEHRLIYQLSASTGQLINAAFDNPLGCAFYQGAWTLV